jgi:hypothetical protein
MMPSYSQPPVTVQGSIWQPGYWAWGPDGYYWVPGTYVAPPSLGLLWTPGFWGMNPYGAGYSWNQGYWAPNVGYYGGINYGGGYYGTGYVGGEWYNNAFRYNTAVTPVTIDRIHNVYVNKTVIVRNVTRYSYNGPGGVRMEPNAQQRIWMHERHVGLTPVQRAHIDEARQDRNLYAKYNGGRPTQTVAVHPLSTTNKPANFKPLNTSAKPAPKAPPEQMHPQNKPAPPMKPESKPAPVAKPESKPAPPAKAPPPMKAQPPKQEQPQTKAPEAKQTHPPRM